MTTFDTAGEPQPDEAGTEDLDTAGIDSSAVTADTAAGQTVTNDAVAGETVYEGTDGLPTARESSPEYKGLTPANDGYLAPTNQTGEDIDLDDEPDGTPEARGERE